DRAVRALRRSRKCATRFSTKCLGKAGWEKITKSCTRALGMNVSATTRTKLYTSLIIGVVTLIVYWPALRNNFVGYDDADYVTANSRVLAGLNSASVAWAFRSTSGNWHPLTWLSHMLDCSLYNLNASGHHLTNVLLHTANSILVFLFLAKMTGAFGRS